VDPALVRAAQAWILDDPDSGDRAEIRRLLDSADEAALADRFAGPLQFGTAGIRGRMRAGLNGINRVTIRRTAAGVAGFLSSADPTLSSTHVVVAFDGRHRSRTFAEDAARVLAGAGLRVLLVPDPVPTPLLAFAVRHLRCAAGLMVTASHNPATDNGVKVYLGAAAGSPEDGAQIVPPTDAAIETAIADVTSVRDLPLADPELLPAADVAEAYLAALPEVAPQNLHLRLAYTPLHGVGQAVLVPALVRAGFPAPAVVADQAEPDPAFPTVPFPNPEEPGVLDRLLELVASTGADLGIASDPDADRCGALVSDRILTGDEIGCLLADAILRRRPGPVATSFVSATMLAAMARRAGVPCHITGTGFKWLMRADPDLVFAYEEALGYAVAPAVVRDKDGISAALLLADLAGELRRSGRTLLDRLDELAGEFGLHLTRGLQLPVDHPRQALARVEEIAADPPQRLANRVVLRTTGPGPGGRGAPPGDGVVLHLEGDARVVLRASGTEPKLKAYLQVVRPVPTTVAAARTQAGRELDQLVDAVRGLFGRGPQTSNWRSPASPRPGTM
jgi:phosphomannomutase